MTTDMAIIMAMSAVIIDAADDVSADDAADEVDLPRPRNGMAMTLKFCVSLGNKCAGGVESPSQTNGEMFNIESRR